MTALVLLSGFLVALLGCGALRRFALRHALLDRPNERSLHAAPVPRLGGVALVVGTVVPTGLVLFARGSATRDVLMLVVASTLVAGLGLFDDLRPLRASVRFALQIATATAFCIAVPIHGPIDLFTSQSIALPPWLVLALAVVWIVGSLNIFNFMDGMDGLAGTQATGAGVALASSLYLLGHHDLALVAALVAASSAGFLVHNAPPAKIFMGDAGSTFLGFLFAGLPLVAAMRSPSLPFAVGPVALAPFLLDGTFTILRRLRRGEVIWKAHRSHLYQRAVGTGLSHREVLVRYVAWVTAASAGAVVVSRASLLPCLAVVAVMLAMLALMWRWVVRREAAAA